MYYIRGEAEHNITYVQHPYRMGVRIIEYFLVLRRQSMRDVYTRLICAKQTKADKYHSVSYSSIYYPAAGRRSRRSDSRQELQNTFEAS